MNDDQLMLDFQAEFSASYGYGADSVGFPWEDILAMILSMLDGCFMSRTPKELAEQAKRPLVRARMKSKLLQFGVSSASMRDRIVTATATTLEKATEERLASWVAMARAA